METRSLDQGGLTVGAFERHHAIELLNRLGGNAYPVNKELAEAMIDRVGWPVPYYLQLLFNSSSEPIVGRQLFCFWRKSYFNSADAESSRDASWHGN
jgi:hypothetical protein